MPTGADTRPDASPAMKKTMSSTAATTRIASAPPLSFHSEAAARPSGCSKTSTVRTPVAPSA